MSREFGSYSSGYFHTQMENAASDCLSGRNELTKLWGRFFDAFKEVAWDIASAEAFDADSSAPILSNLQQLPALKQALGDIESYLGLFKTVAARAVAEELSKRTEK